VPDWLKRLTRPSAPSGHDRQVGDVLTANVTFSVDASGRVAPVGQTVTKPSAVACAAVMFSMTALAPVAGTPPRPATTRSMVPCGASGTVLVTER